MRCPACQQATHETAAECACGFSLAALDRTLGMPPILKASVTDMVNELTGGEIRSITREIERLERRFPQMTFAVVVCTPPEGTTLALYLFWLCNHSGLGSAIERGGLSRHVMLGIDPFNGLAATMIGYGLEPFISEARLTAALNAAFAPWANDLMGKGIEAFFAALEVQLKEVATTANLSFGLSEIEFENTEQMAELEDARGARY